MRGHVLLYTLVMAAVTYLIRMLPFTLFRKKITSPFFRSFFYYVPYAVLAAMTFPAVFSSTGSFYSALAGVVVAAVLALCKKSLTVVALSACAVAFAVEVIQFGFVM
ncbi:MAG: AzlD domain-containing protein [Clostridia bacterium]|nr:AzlD domain-containing protein [Clostridia bacterium]